MSHVAPTLVPELLVSDLERSLAFWCGLCGFGIDYRREEEGFAYLSRDSAHVMLEQEGVGRNWITASLDRPLGRGINFQISVGDLSPILASLRAAEHPLFMEPEVKRYRVGDSATRDSENASPEEACVEQFLVADPDGYLIRFQRSLGSLTKVERPEIVCICGSVRFMSEILAASRDLTLAGAVVLAPGEMDAPMTEVQRAALGALHLRKIDLADRILVVNPGGYIGESTRKEIAYAEAAGKPVSFTDPA